MLPAGELALSLWAGNCLRPRLGLHLGVTTPRHCSWHRVGVTCIDVNHTVPSHPWECPTLRLYEGLRPSLPLTLFRWKQPLPWQKTGVPGGATFWAERLGLAYMDGRERMKMWSAPERLGPVVSR